MTRDRKQASWVVCGAHLWDGDINAGDGMMACEGFHLDLFSRRYSSDIVILSLSCLALPWFHFFSKNPVYISTK